MSGVEIILRGTPDEIAALVVGLQGQQDHINFSGNTGELVRAIGDPVEVMKKAVLTAIDGTAVESQGSSSQLSGTGNCTDPA